MTNVPRLDPRVALASEREPEEASPLVGILLLRSLELDPACDFCGELLDEKRVGIAGN